MTMVSPEFHVPVCYEADDLVFLPLGPWMASMDYATWSKPKTKKWIRRTRGDDLVGSWLDADIDEAKNELDLVRHQKEFERRFAFAYAIFNHKWYRERHGLEMLGCIYLYPPGYWEGTQTRPRGTDWNFWTVPDWDLYKQVYNISLHWLQTDWPWKTENLKCTNKIVPV